MFEGSDWRLHPDWVYCQYNYAGDRGHEFPTIEDTMRHFFVRMQRAKWTWGTPRVRPLPKCTNKETFNPNCIKCKDKKAHSRFEMVYASLHGWLAQSLSSHLCSIICAAANAFLFPVCPFFSPFLSPFCFIIIPCAAHGMDMMDRKSHVCEYK